MRAHTAAAFFDDLVEDVRSAVKSQSPVRCSLEMTSEFVFVSDAVQAIKAASPELADHATMLVREALLDPSIALSMAKDDGQRILQAVVVARDEALGLDFDVRVVVEADVTPRGQVRGFKPHPPIARMASARVDLLDLDDDGDVRSCILELVNWSREFSAPAFPSASAPLQVVLAGNPSVCLGGVPESWRDDFSALAAVFGARFRSELLERQKDADFGKATTHVIVVEPRLFSFIADVETHSAVIVQHDALGLTYSQLKQVVMTDLLGAAPRREERGRTLHHLSEGEQRFHRKTQNSGGGYDVFEVVSPCSHKDGFKRYTAAPQAEKGMVRLYDNFERSMLHHCTNGKCNIYAVFA